MSIIIENLKISPNVIDIGDEVNVVFEAKALESDASVEVIYFLDQLSPIRLGIDANEFSSYSKELKVLANQTSIIKERFEISLKEVDIALPCMFTLSVKVSYKTPFGLKVTAPIKDKFTILHPEVETIDIDHL
jgi:hypothetical protein